jgi:hypothetical protein
MLANLLRRLRPSRKRTTIRKKIPPGAKKEKIHYLWAILIARIYEILQLECPRCHKEMKILSFITQTYS